MNRIGIYVPESPSQAMERASAFETIIGRKVDILSFYEAWENNRGPDVAGIESCLMHGFVPMITWEPWRLPPHGLTGRPENQKEYSLAAILSGAYEGYIKQWALELKRLSSPIFLRPMHEMNGNWYPWCVGVNGNRSRDYVAAWRYIRSVFRKAGCRMVTWVWSPYAETVPREAGNSPDRCFPGSEEVDWLALDGYNWGSTQEWSRWQTFEKVFGDAYEQLRTLDSHKPVMIAEMGCAEQGGDKSLWIQGAADALANRFEGIRIAVQFSVNKECDWRVESSGKSLAAFRTHFSKW